MSYLGNTQQHPKKRMQGHAQDVRRLFISGVKSDSFAEHFCQFIPPPKDATEKVKVQDHIKYRFEIVWKGNALNTVKTFGTRGCSLCTQERLEILKAVHKNPKASINAKNEIYGACRHKPRFHRYLKQSTVSTDESIADERVEPPSSTTSSSSSFSQNSQKSIYVSRWDFMTPESHHEILGDPSVAPATDEASSSAVGLTGGPSSDLDFDLERVDELAW
jgi:hypothetical protein